MKGGKEKVCRFCLWCDGAMRRSQRIEMGWDVMVGRIAVCSIRCRDAYNTKGASLARREGRGVSDSQP